MTSILILRATYPNIYFNVFILIEILILNDSDEMHYITDL